MGQCPWTTCQMDGSGSYIFRFPVYMYYIINQRSKDWWGARLGVMRTMEYRNYSCDCLTRCNRGDLLKQLMYCQNLNPRFCQHAVGGCVQVLFYFFLLSGLFKLRMVACLPTITARYAGWISLTLKQKTRFRKALEQLKLE